MNYANMKSVNDLIYKKKTLKHLNYSTFVRTSGSTANSSNKGIWQINHDNLLCDSNHWQPFSIPHASGVIMGLFYEHSKTSSPKSPLLTNKHGIEIQVGTTEQTHNSETHMKMNISNLMKQEQIRQILLLPNAWAFIKWKSLFSPFLCTIPCHFTVFLSIIVLF